VSYVLSGVNAPSEQFKLVASGVGWQHEYLGRFRLDTIQFRDVIIPDSHLFDGLALLAFSPAKLAEELSRDRFQIPLIVKRRAESLEASLRELLLLPGHGGTLNGFAFKALGSPEKWIPIAEEIGKRTQKELESFLQIGAVKGLGQFLGAVARDLGLDIGDELETMQRGWAAWLQGEADGTIRSERWTGRFDAKRAAACTPFNHPADPELSEHFTIVRRMVARDGALSSEVDSYLAHAGRGASPNELVAFDELKDWEREVRRKALAMRYGAAFRRPSRESARDRSLWNRLTAVDPPRGTDILYPEAFTFRLGQLEPAAYRAALDSAALEGWWSTGRRESLRRVVGDVAETVEGSVDSQPRGRLLANLREVDFVTFVAEKAPGALAGALGALVGSQVSGTPGVFAGALAGPIIEAVLGSASARKIAAGRDARMVTEYFDSSTFYPAAPR